MRALELSGYVFTGGTLAPHTPWGQIIGYWSKPVLDIVRDYFPDADNVEADWRLWNQTGFPSFWNYEPERCLRDQLRDAMLVEGSALCMSYCCGRALHAFEMRDELFCQSCDDIQRERLLKELGDSEQIA